MFAELKHIEFIELPVLDFKKQEICLLFNNLGLIAVSFFKKKVGKGFPLPNGCNFFKSSENFLFNAEKETSLSYLNSSSLLLIFFKIS